MGVVVYVAGVQLGIGLLSAAPFIYHRYRIGKWLRSAPPLSLPQISNSKLPTMTLVLPLWNEELIIRKKLDDLAKQEYPKDKLRLLIIDSASTDSTLPIVKSWIEENNSTFSMIEIIEMSTRLGKTAAINKAFNAAKKSSKILAMTDADAMLSAGSLLRLGAWFENPEIGAVGGTPRRFSAEQTEHGEIEHGYRDLFSMQRLAESMIDSTPFLEGSIMAIRSSIFDKTRLNEFANADDAQLAVSARMSGSRSIVDEKLIFIEPIPPTRREHMQQKVRRAQGLQRLLFTWRRKKGGMEKTGPFSSIMKWQGIMHLEVPWLVATGTAVAALKWIFVLANGGTSALVYFTMVLDLLVFGGWFSRRIGLKIPGSKLITMFMDSMYALIKAQILLLRGKSLHLWPQGKGVRKAWLNEE